MKVLTNLVLIVLTVFVIQKGQTAIGITNLGLHKDGHHLIVYDGPITQDHCHRYVIPIKKSKLPRVIKFYSLVTHKKYQLIDFDSGNESITIREEI